MYTLFYKNSFSKNHEAQNQKIKDIHHYRADLPCNVIHTSIKCF